MIQDTLVARTFEPLEKQSFIRLETKYCKIHSLYYWYDTVTQKGGCGLCKTGEDNMTKLNEVFSSVSTYLKKKDVRKLPDILTINEIEIKDIGEGEQARKKIVLSFEETDMVLVCNKINATNISEISAQEEIEDWIGTKIQIYIDPNVQFKGEKIGGLRVRKPEGTPAPKPKPKEKEKE